MVWKARGADTEAAGSNPAGGPFHYPLSKSLIPYRIYGNYVGAKSFVCKLVGACRLRRPRHDWLMR